MKNNKKTGTAEEVNTAKILTTWANGAYQFHAGQKFGSGRYKKMGKQFLSDIFCSDQDFPLSFEVKALMSLDFRNYKDMSKLWEQASQSALEASKIAVLLVKITRGNRYLASTTNLDKCKLYGLQADLNLHVYKLEDVINEYDFENFIDTVLN